MARCSKFLVRYGTAAAVVAAAAAAVGGGHVRESRQGAKSLHVISTKVQEATALSRKETKGTEILVVRLRIAVPI